MQTRISQPPLWVVNLTAFCLSVALVTGLVYMSAENLIERKKEEMREAARALPAIQDLAVNPFKDIELASKAAVVYDISRGQIVFERNSQAQLPLASLTKLMTALVVSETLPEYTAIEILPREKEQDVKLKVGERWSLKDLLSYTLVTSSNTGADSLAAAAASYLEGKGTSATFNAEQPSSFVSAMNQKAQELGLKQTYFLNPSGLDTNNDVSGAYGSAYDIATLLSYIITEHHGLLTATEQPELVFVAPDGRKITAQNTNERAVAVPGILASKTGLTDLAGGNLAVAFNASFDEPFVVVVLGSSQEERFSDVEKLIEATIRYLGSRLKGNSGPENNPISAYSTSL